MTTPNLKTNMLAFTRSFEISEGPFSALDAAGNEIPIGVHEKSVRGQISNFIAKNGSKSGKELNVDKPNLQTVDVALTPAEAHELQISFNLRTVGMSTKPWASDEQSVAANYQEIAERYSQRAGYRFLANRYVWNIANARWVWRNRFLAVNPRVIVDFIDDYGSDRTVTFDPFKLKLDGYPGFDVIKNAADDADKVEALTRGIAEALAGGYFLSRVRFRTNTVPHAEVFPSEELLTKDAENNRQRDAGKRLSSIPTRFGDTTVHQATFHSQKIGAALRCIDQWHRHSDYSEIVVPANPYAVMVERMVALRPRGKKSFYDLVEKPDRMLTYLEQSGDFDEGDADPDGLHFFMANLVRGGVFGAKGD